MKKILPLVVALTASFTISAQKPYKAYTEQWTGSAWDSLYINTYTYNPQFHLLADDEIDWDGTAWVNTALNTYSNDATGNPTIQLGQQWNSGTTSWENSTKSLMTYTVNNLLESINQTWNGSSFDNNDRQTNTYDANSFLVQVLSETWNGSSWDNSAKTTFTNDVNGAPVNMLQQQWNGSSWDDNFRGTMTNTLTSALTGTFEIWMGSSWMEIFEFSNTYDANLKITSALFKAWNGTSMENSSLDTYTYDAANNNTLTLTELWDTNIADWVQAYRTTTYYYATLPAVKTVTVSGITQVSATADASVTASGGATVNRGICYNTSPAPLVTDMNAPAGTGLGPYTATLSGLTPNTTYYTRAYATNSLGTVYGEELSFTTDLDVGFDPVLLTGPFRVYPQPASDILNVQSLKSTDCMMYDISGRAIQEVKINIGTTTIDISKFAPGVYFLGERSNSVRFIKE